VEFTLNNQDISLEPEDVIDQLLKGRYDSSVGRILNFVGSIIQRISRRRKLPAPSVSALTFSLIISIIALLGSIFFSGVTSYEYRIIASGGLLIFINLVIAKTIFDRVFTTLQSKLLVKLGSNRGVAGIQAWLITAQNLKWPLLIGFIVFLAYAFFILPNPINASFIPADLVMGGTMLLWTGFLIYYMILFMILSQRLSQLDFELHKEDPVSSEVLLDWSRMMNLAAYLFAFMLATGTFFYVSAGTFSLQILYFIIPRWLLLIGLFVINQLAFSTVITRSKRASLNDVESLMADLRPKGRSPDHDKMETILYMWDYHDRIKSTRNTILDFYGIANLTNTLLIPLIAYALANLKILLQFFGW
jgi:hypothetical protein